MSIVEGKIFPVTLDSLKELREYVLAATALTTLDKKKSYKLQLAIDEMATNIISYGFPDEDNVGNVCIDAEIRENSLIIYLRDQGIAFNPRELVEHEKENISKSAEERCIGGLGIYLAITGVDNFDYAYQDGFNVNRFEVYFDKTD